MKQYFHYFYIILVSGCASVAMPTGGPKDETPPELLNSTPANNEKNYTGKIIELDFNEDIKLKDPKEEILITPAVGKETKFTVKKKKLTIEPELPWQENTTYSINFREGVQDLNEGNPAENLRLAFSSGPTIDSLKIFGSVRELFSDKKSDKITVALYASDTFDIFKHTPIYFTKTNKKGIFSIENLKAGEYYVYAFDDKNKNLKVDSKTEKFTFKNSKIFLPFAKQDSSILSLIQVDARPISISAIRNTDKTTRIRFNKLLDSLFISGFNKNDGLYSFGENRSEVIFYQTFEVSDSIQIKLIGTDSTLQRIDTTFYLKYSDTKTAQGSFKSKEIMQKYDPSKKLFFHQMEFTKPLSQIIYDSIYIEYDSATIQKVTPDQIVYDTLNNLIKGTYPINTIIPEGEKKPLKPKIRYRNSAFISIESDSSKTSNIEVTIPIEEELATVLVEVKTKEAFYIIQLLDNENNITEEIRNSKSHTFKYIKPKEYKLRVIVDSNNNGRWDAGNFYDKKEPEKIIYYKTEEKKLNFPVRANWEIGPLLIEF